jgi:peptidoglycan/xylan/chitin deacetylase (PgdA/CDA1 family)
MKSTTHHSLVSLREKALAPIRFQRLRSKYPGVIPGRRILLFHGIDDNNCTRYNTRFISTKKFEALLVLLKNNCHLVSLDDYCQGLTDPDRLNITLSFDDAYRNNLTHALPLLEKYGIPATLFSTAIHLENKDILWADLYDLCCDILPQEIEICGTSFLRNVRGAHTDQQGFSLKAHAARSDRTFILQLYQTLENFAHFRNHEKLEVLWQLLSPKDLGQLSRHPLITIGSHGRLHLSYPYIDAELAFADMCESKSALEQITGMTVKHLAFPVEGHSIESLALAKKAGYEFQFIETASGEDLADTPGCFARFGMNPFISAEHQFLYIQQGSY